MPVPTGYAVPIGIVCTAFANRVMLRVRHTMNPNPQRHHGVPDNPFILPRQNGKPVSKHPAIIRKIQFIKVKNVLLRAAVITGVSFQGPMRMQSYKINFRWVIGVDEYL